MPYLERMVASPRHVRRKKCPWFVTTGARICPSLAVAPAAVAYQLVVFQCVCVCPCVLLCAMRTHTHTHTLNTHTHTDMGRACGSHCLTFLPPTSTDPGPMALTVSIATNIKHHEPCSTMHKLQSAVCMIGWLSQVWCTVLFMPVHGVMQLKGKIQENPQMWPIQQVAV